MNALKIPISSTTIDVVERPATKPNTPASKKPINSYFVPQGRTTTIASSSLLDYPKESDRQSTSEPGEPGSESHLEIITESYHPDFQPLLQTVKLQLKHYQEAVLKTNDNLKIVSLKVASVTQEGLCMHIPLKEFLAIFNQWNPLKEFHRLMEENDLLMEELEAQGINTKRSTIILNKFKDTQAEDQAQSTKMEIGSTTQRQHKPIPSQASTSPESVWAREEQQKTLPRETLDRGLQRPATSSSTPETGTEKLSDELTQGLPSLDSRRNDPYRSNPPGSVPTTGRNVSYERTRTTSSTPRGRGDGVRAISYSESNSDRLQKSRISLVRNFSKTLLSSSQSSTETLGSINKSQTDVLNLLWSSIVNK
ncbi:hypothetical protein Pst134EB_016934 [Puccinia striiformis f. sp. tritici]|nr:hypothetical protein Pst134EB_016934 [Puccinia striiformis f. sp. tritici]